MENSVTMPMGLVETFTQLMVLTTNCTLEDLNMMVLVKTPISWLALRHLSLILMASYWNILSKVNVQQSRLLSMYHISLRVLTTSLWDPRSLIYVLESMASSKLYFPLRNRSLAPCNIYNQRIINFINCNVQEYHN